MTTQEKLAYLASEFRRLVMRVDTEDDALLLLEKIMSEAYAMGVKDEARRHVAEDCLGG